MLQQTQTFRVVPKYNAFLKTFATLGALAKAPLSHVLALWQGLGYNRRALMLHRAAQVAMRSHSGKLPVSYEELLALPGIGPYTAGAVMVFAHNSSQVIIETNIRGALIHEFFPRVRKVQDGRLVPLLAQAVPKKNTRQFYQALMDYGAFLKQKYPNPSRRSSHHSKQSKFEGSNRQIRGHIIRELARKAPLAATQLVLGDPLKCKVILDALLSEGLVQRHKGRYRLPI